MAARRRGGATKRFFDTDALGQLPPHARSDLPFSPEMATGEMFVGRALEEDISLMLVKGLGGQTLEVKCCARAHAPQTALRRV